MRSLIVMAMFAASLSNAAWNGYTESRDLELPADGIDLLEIDAGAGAIVVTGDASLRSIRVTAVINVDDDDDNARELIEKELVLKLEQKRDRALLDAYFEHNFWQFKGSASVDLDVRVPHGLAVFVDDGSGPITIEAVGSDVEIDDGSGDIRIRGVGGKVRIDDGSGSIRVEDVEGDLDIVSDGSGSVRLADIRGAVGQDD